MADVKFTNNSDEVRAALLGKIPVALEAIGLKAEGYAKRMAPVDTGNLRKSITHTVSGDTAAIGTNVEYAAYVEMGTSKTKAQPYLRPAVQNHQDVYIRMVKHFLKND